MRILFKKIFFINNGFETICLLEKLAYNLKIMKNEFCFELPLVEGVLNVEFLNRPLQRLRNS